MQQKINQEKQEINQEINKENKKEEKKTNKNSNLFWKGFWITIIIFLAIYLFLNIVAVNKLNNTKPKPLITEQLIEEIKKKAPKLVSIIENLPNNYKKKIQESIDKNIDRAFAPLYTHINDFADFHYSVKGEYTELAATLTNNIQKFLTDKIFKPANFEKNLNNALNNINSDVKNILRDYYSQIKNQLKTQFNLNDKQTDIVINKIFALSKNDVLQRFNNELYDSLREIGLGGGAATAIVIKKLMTKNISKAITKKILAKITLKASSKVAAAAAGAATGIESGLSCGPGAILCSPIGGAIGAVVGWFATDKIVVEIDKYFNEDKFKQQIKHLIDKQKEQTKQTLYKIYFNTFEKINKQNKEKIKEIEKLKKEKIINIIK
jgi:uncharacterized protein YsxB (DUF464 family)